MRFLHWTEEFFLNSSLGQLDRLTPAEDGSLDRMEFVPAQGEEEPAET